MCHAGAIGARHRQRRQAAMTIIMGTTSAAVKSQFTTGLFSGIALQDLARLPDAVQRSGTI